MAKKLLLNNKKEPSLFNEFVFDTSKTPSDLTVTFQNYRGGDTTVWDGLTDWGDGTVDTSLTHTYSSHGIYTVKTKYLMTDTFGDRILNTIKKLVNCNAINSNITSYIYMFYNCSNLTSLDLSNFDTSKVIDMSYMFAYCSSLISLDLSRFDISNVTNINNMFRNCPSLSSLNLFSFNTSNITNMSYMFAYCSNLTSLNLFNFDTSKVTNMSSMFRNCSNLTSLNLSNFDTSKVTGMSYMFYNCSLLKRGDIILTNVSSTDITKLESAGMPK